MLLTIGVVYEVMMNVLLFVLGDISGFSNEKTLRHQLSSRMTA